MTILSRFKNWLSAPVDGHVLGLFRIIFGLFMAYEAWVYYRMGLIDNGLLAPKILFKFDGMGWVPLLPKPAMLTVLAIMGLSALLMALGLLFRQACWLFSLSLAFIFFQEKSYYNNHIYLFILLGVLLSFTDADRFLSVRGKSSAFNAVPRWQQFILQAQIVIVYFYGGITKLRSDWIFHQEPVASMVATFPADHWLAPVFKTGFMVNTLTYGGLLLDILAPLLLWYKPVRRWALIPFVVFHFSNSRIFNDIGIFPFVMLATLILFFDTQEIPWFRRLAAVAPAADKKAKALAAPLVPVTTARVKKALIAYFTFQLLFPLRGFFLPNDMDWTGVAKNFSWRMKADTRPIEAFEVMVQDPATGQALRVDVRSFVNEMQVLNMSLDARSVVAFARMLREEMGRRGMSDAIVKARILVRYNGRPAQLFVNPDLDLASVRYSPFEKMNWVMPLNE